MEGANLRICRVSWQAGDLGELQVQWLQTQNPGRVNVQFQSEGRKKN